ncbi:Vacuolar sorting-associated 13C [Brachionus plicatilis]|uniref:Vacuolar sorting-associated 13C n=1 Tax=Brachionus plicatilis TaxID=10195 RepID=A0A3M7REZ9_BRAPC|nr:Vacuolar sorting-associated 13C [Brachionus plicatilis]
MGKTNERLSKKCPKCNQVRFKDLPRNRYFELSSNESVEIANLFKSNVILSKKDLICNNCYNKAFNLFKIQTKISNESVSSTVVPDRLLVETSSPCFLNTQETIIEDIQENEFSAGIKDKIPDEVKICSKEENTESEESQFIYINLPKSFSSHKNCVICRNNCTKLHLIQSEARIQALLSKNIFIPRGSRTCQSHLNEAGLFKNDHLDLIKISKYESKINRVSANDLIQTLIEASKKKSLFYEFSDPSKIDNDTCKNTTGFNKEEFNIICSYLDEMKDSQVRTKSQALAIYLFWLKTGMTQRVIKAHFRLNERVDVSRYCEQVRMSLLAKFVPDFLGPDVMERSEWVKQNTEIAKELYGLKDDNLLNKVNELEKCVNCLKLSYSAEFVNLVEKNLLNDFPRLSYDFILENITFGSYQLKQSLGYLAEHLDKNGKLIIKINKQTSLNFKPDTKVLMGRIQSRHSGAITYKVFVSYIVNECLENQIPINGCLSLQMVVELSIVLVLILERKS